MAAARANSLASANNVDANRANRDGCTGAVGVDRGRGKRGRMAGGEPVGGLDAADLGSLQRDACVDGGAALGMVWMGQTKRRDAVSGAGGMGAGSAPCALGVYAGGEVLRAIGERTGRGFLGGERLAPERARLPNNAPPVPGIFPELFLDGAVDRGGELCVANAKTRRGKVWCFTAAEVRRGLRQPASFYELAARLRKLFKVPRQRSVNLRDGLSELIEAEEVRSWTVWPAAGGPSKLVYWVPNGKEREG